MGTATPATSEWRWIQTHQELRKSLIRPTRQRTGLNPYLVIGLAEPGVEVTLTVNSTDYTTPAGGYSEADENLAEWRVWVDLDPGSNSLVAVATDQAGNVSQPSSSRSLILDDSPPIVATTVDPLWVQPNETVMIEATVTEAGPLENGWVQAQIVGPDGANKQLRYVSGDLWATTDNPFITSAPGVYDVTVTALDKAGNVGQDSQVLIVDNTLPTLNLTLSGVTPTSHAEADTLYYNPTTTGQFEVTALVEDSLSGLETVTFPTTVAPGSSHLDLAGGDKLEPGAKLHLRR